MKPNFSPRTFNIFSKLDSMCYEAINTPFHKHKRVIVQVKVIVGSLPGIISVFRRILLPVHMTEVKFLPNIIRAWDHHRHSTQHNENDCQTTKQLLNGKQTKTDAPVGLFLALCSTPSQYYHLIC